MHFSFIHLIDHESTKETVIKFKQKECAQIDTGIRIDLSTGKSAEMLILRYAMNEKIEYIGKASPRISQYSVESITVIANQIALLPTGWYSLVIRILNQFRRGSPSWLFRLVTDRTRMGLESPGIVVNTHWQDH